MGCHGPETLETRRWTLLRWTAVVLAVKTVEAAVEDFACARDGSFIEVIQYLEQAFAQPKSVVPPNRRILAGLERVDAYLGAFGFRVSAGAVGWQKLFEALQGCPLVFVALEMAYAVGAWNGTDGVEYGLRGFSGSLGLQGHSAKALALARSWRSWFETNPRIQAELGWNFVQICEGVLQWPHLNQMAQVALAALNCERPGPTSLAELLGCASTSTTSFPSLRCAQPVDPALESLGAFWDQLQDAMVISPTLQMPYGPGQPYLLQLILEELSTKPLGRELYLEFGVFQGDSLNFLARGLHDVTLYGFDSFRGLPAAWRDGSDIPGALSFGASSFAVAQLPQVEENVRLIPGWFNETIPAFVAGLVAALEATERNDVTIRLLHIDCDMYSSAMEVLFGLANFLRAGSLLVFDELLNFPYFEREELRAFYEFLRQHRWKYRIVHAPWFFLPSTSDFAELYQKDGLSEIDLLQAVAVELL